MKPRTRQDCSLLQGGPLPQSGPGSKTNSKSAQTPKLRAFLFPNPTILLPLPGILLLCPCTLLRWPTFCSCVPVLCSGGQPFYFRWSGILPLVSHHSAPGCQPFYFPVSRNSTSAAQDSAPTAHSISPKGHSPLRDSAFQFPTFSITFPKPTFTTSRPTSPVTRAQKPRFCAREARKRGFQTLKAHKKPDFVLEKKGIGIGNRKSGLPANHRARFQNANAS